MTVTSPDRASSARLIACLLCAILCAGLSGGWLAETLGGLTPAVRFGLKTALILIALVSICAMWPDVTPTDPPASSAQVWTGDGRHRDGYCRMSRDVAAATLRIAVDVDVLEQVVGPADRFVHMINWDRVFDAKLLDPARIESFMYAQTDRGLVVIGPVGLG